MPTTSLTFAYSKPLDPSHRLRAFADVSILDSTGTLSLSPCYRRLVDTGADVTILPMSAATLAGIVPAGPPVTFRSAGGNSYTLPSHMAVHLSVEGHPIVARVAFSTTGAFSPVLDRMELLQAFHFAFAGTTWHWG